MAKDTWERVNAIFNFDFRGSVSWYDGKSNTDCRQALDENQKFYFGVMLEQLDVFFILAFLFHRHVFHFLRVSLATAEEKKKTRIFHFVAHFVAMAIMRMKRQSQKKEIDGPSRKPQMMRLADRNNVCTKTKQRTTVSLSRTWSWTEIIRKWKLNYISKFRRKREEWSERTYKWELDRASDCHNVNTEHAVRSSKMVFLILFFVHTDAHLLSLLCSMLLLFKLFHSVLGCCSMLSCCCLF